MVNIVGAYNAGNSLSVSLILLHISVPEDTEHHLCLELLFYTWVKLIQKSS